MRFRDRADAGRQLAEQLAGLTQERPLVLALPRGGVPVGAELARALGAPLDVWVVRKVGVPWAPEFGVGAVAEGGVLFLDPEGLQQVGVTEEALQDTVHEKRLEVLERVRRYRRGRPAPRLAGRTVLLVDDGIATGGTVRAALQALRARRPRRIVLAVPVAATQSLEQLEPLVDELVCVQPTATLRAIGDWYDDFQHVSDDEVARLLAQSRERSSAEAEAAQPEVARAPPRERPLALDLGEVQLTGDLVVPPRAQGLVLFAHGSGSSRKSPRNRRVAAALQAAGLATLLFDLLTPEEEAFDASTGELRFDIGLLAERLARACVWTRGLPQTQALPLGLFGSSTGAAAALVAAAVLPGKVGAVVSRGGRVDLAGQSLNRVQAPTLLIVGGDDREVLALNRWALAELSAAPAQLEIVPGATHLFEEPGALEAVAQHAAGWFSEHLHAPSPQEDAGAPAP